MVDKYWFRLYYIDYKRIRKDNKSLFLDQYFYQSHKILDAINENVTHYGLPELKSNKFADIWPISIDRADLGWGGVESGNLS